MMTPEFVKNFARVALRKGMRHALLVADTTPVPTDVMVVARDGAEIVGARIYFKMPNKTVWVQAPSAECEAGDILHDPTVYDRKSKHTKIDDVFFVFPAVLSAVPGGGYTVEQGQCVELGP